MSKHELKLDSKFFDDVKSGKKNFEIRNNDRGFEIGDILELKSYSPQTNSYVVDSHLYSNKSDYADTVKVKVLDIFKPEQINPDLKIVNGREYVMNLHIALFLKGVSNVLKNYFNTDKVPDDYVVMAIEVAE